MANIVKINGKYVKDITARNEITNLASQTGELTNLNTTAKNNLVAAINEVAQSDVSALQTALSAYPTSTVSGSVVSITDGADGLPVKALTVDIVSAQSGSGVPSPSNVRNIIGKSSAIVYVSGANLYNSSQNVRGTFGTDGAVVESDSATTEITDFIQVNDAFTVRGHIYTSQGSYPRETVMACIYDEDKVFVREYGIPYTSNGDGSFRLPLNSGEKYVRYTITANNISNSEYQMYSENIYQINWSDEAGTICDGTLDVTNGLLTVDRVMITLDGSETWNMNGSNESGFICNAPVPISKLSANSNTSNIVSNMFTIVGNSSVGNPSTTTTGIPSGGGSPLLMYFYLRYDFMADIEAWKTWLATNNVQVSYLIEPKPYQLNPTEVLTLLGTNTIYTNCGDVSVTYRADPTLYSQTGAVTLDSGDISFSYLSTYPSGTVGYNLKDIGDNLVSLTQDFNQFSGDSIPLHMDGFLPSEESISDVIGDLSDLDTTAKSNLVAAINEAAQSSGGGTLYIHICTNGEYNSNTGVPTIQNPNETTIYLVPDGTGNDLYVEWIYVNNAWEISGSASINLTDYVKNTDYANSTTGGVIKLGQRTSSGLAMGSDGKLFLSRADISEIKAATSTVLPIVPSHQHESVFFGLAKAAGDSTQNGSNNSVGNYTNNAKAAIKNMLGVSNAGDIEYDDTETYAAGTMGAGLSELKSAIEDSPTIADTDETDSDLDIADSQGYVIARFSDGHIQTKNFDSSQIDSRIAAVSVGFEYKFSGNDLLIGYGYNSTHDAVIVMNCGRANGLFDFAALKMKPKGTSLSGLETADLISVWSSSTDMHSPFHVLAVNNADGYHSDATSANVSFTGGNHTLDSMGNGWETASSNGVTFYADGRPVTSGYGVCAKFEMRWSNDVQAYNTVKQGGGGRAVLTEYHDMIFDGVSFNESVRLEALEDIKLSLWYGLQMVSFGSTYTNIAFEDATNRQIFVSTDSGIKSGNAVTAGILSWGSTHAVELTIDTAFDLGKRTDYSGDEGAFATSYGKAYFTIINKYSGLLMGPNTNLYLRGTFRFFPIN